MVSLSPHENSRRRYRANRSPSPRPLSRHASPKRRAEDASKVFGKLGSGGEISPGGPEKSAAELAEAEACKMREAVKASYRPRVSQVYGVHVPLSERAARLQCLAMLSLVAGGEDDAGAGGGSGSGGERRTVDKLRGILFCVFAILLMGFGHGVVVC